MSKLSRREIIQLLAGAAAVPVVAAEQSTSSALLVLPTAASPVVSERIKERFQSLPLESQQIGGLFAQRMQINVERALLNIDEKAYLSAFINRPHEPVLGDQPPGAGWVGEHIGKWLDAAANSLRYLPDAKLRELADRMARALIATQAPDGYLGTYAPNQRWTAWDVWTHKYNLIGLLSYYDLTADAAALKACCGVGDLLARTFGDAPGQRDIVFNAYAAPDLKSGTVGGVESTSILEPICKLYRYTGERRYLEFAHYIVRAYEHPGAPDLVRRSIDASSLARSKAYEMLSNLVGLVDLYRLTGDPRLLEAVMRDWEEIRQHQLYITGTVASRENFQIPGRPLSLFSSDVGENCATVSWLQLNWRLLRLTGEPRFGQQIERTVYNQLLAAHDPHTGRFSFFASLTGKKEFTAGLVCCVSSGKRGLPLLPQMVWGVESDAFVINLYTPGEARFKSGTVPIRAISRTSFPAEGDVLLTLEPERPTFFMVKLRVPEWSSHFVATVGSKKYHGAPGQMLDICQTWKAGTTIHIEMDLPTRVLSGAPTYPDYVALQRGPQVLAMERRLNPDIPYLHRTALKHSRLQVNAEPVGLGVDVLNPQVYAIEGIIGVPGESDKLAPQAGRIQFVPFADAVEYRVWMSRSGHLRHDVPALTAFARASVSPDLLRPGGNRLEALTDENPDTVCTCDPRSYGIDSILKGSLGRRGDPVSFTVTLDASTRISRIVFRHGRSAVDGGWFDTSAGAPQIEILQRMFYVKDADGKDTSYPDHGNAPWEKIADLESYPRSGQSNPPDLEDGQPFEVRLPEPVSVCAIRVVGKPGGDYASCAELSAYA